MLSAWQRGHARGSAEQLRTWRAEDAPTAPVCFPGFCLLLRPCPHSNCPGNLETPVETFCSRRFPPSGFATGHATFPAGMAVSMQLPGSVQLPQEHQLGLETFSGFIFFLNGVAVAWLVSHSLLKLSALPQEFEAVQTNSLGRLS